MKNSENQAFPILYKEGFHSQDGLTKREYFAGLAMQGLLAAVYSTKEMLDEFTVDETGFRKHLTGCDAITISSLAYADALLSKLEKKSDPST